jgi:hypothetical protein
MTRTLRIDAAGSDISATQGQLSDFSGKFRKPFVFNKLGL